MLQFFFYKENTRDMENPCDRLKPSMSFRGAELCINRAFNIFRCFEKLWFASPVFFFTSVTLLTVAKGNIVATDSFLSGYSSLFPFFIRCYSGTEVLSTTSQEKNPQD